MDADRTSEEFFAEAGELVGSLAHELTELQARVRAGDEGVEALDATFRAIHTLKGLSRIFGVGAIARLAHLLEDLLDAMRFGRVISTERALELLFAGVDDLHRILDAGSGAEDVRVDLDAYAAHIERLLELPTADGGAALSQHGLDAALVALLTDHEAHRLQTNLDRGRTIHSLRVRAPLDHVEATLRGLEERCHGSAEVLAYFPRADSNAAGDAEIELLLASASSGDALAEALGVDRAALTVAATPKARPVHEAQRSLVARAAASVVNAPVATLAPRRAPQGARVDTRKLDHLMELAAAFGPIEGEFDRLIDALRERGGDPTLARDAQRARRALRRRIRDLHEGVLDARLVKLDQIFARVGAVVRDLAVEQDKRVRFVTRGGDTQVDRAIADELSEAIVHLARNAVDHGVEPAAERERAGKSGTATMSLEAHTAGGRVTIIVSDDGRGILPERVRQSAVDRGLLPPDSAASMRPMELTQLVFTPGLTTAERVSEISGRGVGLDVVRTNVVRLGGSVMLDSVPGHGTRLTLSVPVSLVRVPALVFEVDGRLHAIARDHVQGVRPVEAEELVRTGDRWTLREGDVSVAACPLVVLFRYAPVASVLGALHALVVESDGRRVALLVDRVCGQEDLVVRALGASLRSVPSVVGVAELGDTRLAVVVDAVALIGEVLAREAPGLSRGAT